MPDLQKWARERSEAITRRATLALAPTLARDRADLELSRERSSEREEQETKLPLPAYDPTPQTFARCPWLAGPLGALPLGEAIRDGKITAGRLPSPGTKTQRAARTVFLAARWTPEAADAFQFLLRVAQRLAKERHVKLDGRFCEGSPGRAERARLRAHDCRAARHAGWMYAGDLATAIARLPRLIAEGGLNPYRSNTWDTTQFLACALLDLVRRWQAQLTVGRFVHMDSGGYFARLPRYAVLDLIDEIRRQLRRDGMPRPKYFDVIDCPTCASPTATVTLHNSRHGQGGTCPACGCHVGRSWFRVPRRWLALDDRPLEVEGDGCREPLDSGETLLDVCEPVDVCPRRVNAIERERVHLTPYPNAYAPGSAHVDVYWRAVALLVDLVIQEAGRTHGDALTVYVDLVLRGLPQEYAARMACAGVDGVQQRLVRRVRAALCMLRRKKMQRPPFSLQEIFQLVEWESDTRGNRPSPFFVG